MKNTIFKQNNFETEVNCPEKALNFTTEPLQGSMMVYSGHCPHTKCRRHFSVGLTTNRSLRDLAPMCLRHNGALRLTSHSSVYCFKHDGSTSGADGRVKAMQEYVNNGSGYDSGFRVKPMSECSPVCDVDISRPNFAEVCYGDVLDYHRVRSLRDITPKCLRHIEVPSPASECNGVGAYDKVVVVSGVRDGPDGSV